MFKRSGDLTDAEKRSDLLLRVSRKDTKSFLEKKSKIEKAVIYAVRRVKVMKCLSKYKVF